MRVLVVAAVYQSILSIAEILPPKAKSCLSGTLSERDVANDGSFVTFDVS